MSQRDEVRARWAAREFERKLDIPQPPGAGSWFPLLALAVGMFAWSLADGREGGAFAFGLLALGAGLSLALLRWRHRRR